MGITRNGEIDTESAEIVRMIFDMFLNQDMSVNAIAKYLRTNEIPTPSAYMGYKYTKVNRPYDWSFPIVSRILKFQEYCGDTVKFQNKADFLQSQKNDCQSPKKIG